MVLRSFVQLLVKINLRLLNQNGRRHPDSLVKYSNLNQINFPDLLSTVNWSECAREERNQHDSYDNFIIYF